jgi:hypothetical protein
MFVRSIHALVCAGLLGGCAIASTGKILKGAASVESAERAEAEKYAIYEITRAREYLHKAREEWGYSDFEAAEKFAIQAQEWADKARDKARDHDQPRPTPPPAAPAAPPQTQAAPAEPVPVVVPVTDPNSQPPPTAPAQGN